MTTTTTATAAHVAAAKKAADETREFTEAGRPVIAAIAAQEAAKEVGYIAEFLTRHDSNENIAIVAADLHAAARYAADAARYLTLPA